VMFSFLFPLSIFSSFIFGMSNGLIGGCYLAGEIGFTVKEKQNAYGKKNKRTAKKSQEQT